MKVILVSKHDNVVKIHWLCNLFTHEVESLRKLCGKTINETEYKKFVNNNVSMTRMGTGLEMDKNKVWCVDKSEDNVYVIYVDVIADVVDFHCHKCGRECGTAPDPPKSAVCEDCCDDHQYEYDRGRRGKFCIHCDKEYDYESDYGD